MRVQNPSLRRSLLLGARGEAGPGRRRPPQTGTRWAPAHPYDAEGLQEEPGQPLAKPPARRRAGRAAGAALCARSGKFSAQLLGPPATISHLPKAATAARGSQEEAATHCSSPARCPRSCLQRGARSAAWHLTARHGGETCQRRVLSALGGPKGWWQHVAVPLLHTATTHSPHRVPASCQSMGSGTQKRPLRGFLAERARGALTHGRQGASAPLGGFEVGREGAGLVMG